MSLKTHEAITKLGWTVVLHPPHGPDLAPSDFHLSGALTDAIHGKSFESDDEVIEEVAEYKIQTGTRKQMLLFLTGC
jgi:hypothetical protein